MKDKPKKYIPESLSMMPVKKNIALEALLLAVRAAIKKDIKKPSTGRITVKF